MVLSRLNGTSSAKGKRSDLQIFTRVKRDWNRIPLCAYMVARDRAPKSGALQSRGGEDVFKGVLPARVIGVPYSVKI